MAGRGEAGRDAELSAGGAEGGLLRGPKETVGGEFERLRFGYACVHTQLPSPARTVRLANATPERLRELIAANLDALEAILRWNADHGIRVFRLSSDLVPFGSHPVNRVRWWTEFGPRLDELGALMRAEQMRLSVHPGQFTVLGSPDEGYVASSLGELEYHARLLKAFGLDASHKIVVHLGGVYGDAVAAVERVVRAVERLSGEARARLVLEHDERWSLSEVMPVANRLDCPVVFDAFHHELRPSATCLSVREAVLLAATTWRAGDGRQEVHFSTQEPGRRPGAHSATIDLAALAAFIGAVGDLPLDCVLEVKDKERSVLRARHLLAHG